MSDKDSKVDQDCLKEYFHYDPATGVFTHAKNKRFLGRVSGHKHRLGYLVIGLKRSIYYAHRLAWLYAHGHWPDGEIDHINGDRADNRIANLRVVSRQVNMQNVQTKAARPKATSSYLGVSRDVRMRTRPWRAIVSKDGKNYDCGYWATEEEAHAAYVSMKRAIHPGNVL